MAGQVTRWIMRGLALILAVVLLAAAGVWSMSSRQLATRYDVRPAAVAIPSDSAAIARGRHLATAIGKCVDCHGENLAGQVMAMGPVGSFVPTNLTRGRGGVGDLGDADLVRAIRHGVAPDGRPLVFMPSRAYASMTDADLGAVIAYVRSMPPVDNELPGNSIGPIGRMIIARSPEKLIAAPGLEHAGPSATPVVEGPTAEYGAYLVVIGGCTSCHGADLKGGLQEGPPGTPPSTNLTPSGKLATWSEADFRRALREGQRPDGRTIDPFMPWRLTRLMTDDEITAVWTHLRTLR
jgi:mono/diheme cytochrome c family protein